MSILTDIPILGDAIDAIIKRAVSFIPDADKRLEAEMEVRKYAHEEVLAKIDVDKAQIGLITEEVKSGKALGQWHGAIGWAGAFAIVWNFILMPFLVAIVLVFNPEFPVAKIPMIDWTKLGPIILGMLGLG